MTWNSKSKGKAAAGKVNERLDQLWGMGATGATEVINRNRFLSVASKEGDIAFYMDH